MPSPLPPRPSAFDRLVFAVANTLLYVRHPRFVSIYHRAHGRWPNLAAPGLQSEMMQWRKLFDRNPLMAQLSDKLLAKEWVHAKCPDLGIPETVWTGVRPEDIPAELIAPGYVIKTNHGSSNNYFPEREALSRAELNGRFARWLRHSLAERLEWAYGQIDRKVFVERRIEADGPLLDIGVRAFNGQLGAADIATDYKTDLSRRSYFDLDGRIMPPVADSHDPTLAPDFAAPPGFGKALDYARRLSAGFEFVRVDFLHARGQLYFSEMTFYAASGYAPDGEIGQSNFRNWIGAFANSHFLTTRHAFPMSIYAGAFRRWTEALRLAFATDAGANPAPPPERSDPAP